MEWRTFNQLWAEVSGWYTRIVERGKEYFAEKAVKCIFAFHRHWWKIRTYSASSPAIRWVGGHLSRVGGEWAGVFQRVLYSRHSPKGNWTQTVALVRHPGSVNFRNHFQMWETYDSGHLDADYGVPWENTLYYTLPATVFETTPIRELCVIAKCAVPEKMVVRTRSGANPESAPLRVNDDDGEVSEVEFLSVEYRHPEMSTPLSFSIPRSMYLVGNELFSAGFVLRWLEYQPLWESFQFDELYTLHLIDHHIRQITLHYDEYIVLEKEEYRVVQTPPIETRPM